MKLVKETIQWETPTPKRIAMKRVIRKKKRSRLVGRIMGLLAFVFLFVTAVKLTRNHETDLLKKIAVPQKELDFQKMEFQSLNKLQLMDTNWIHISGTKGQQGFSL